jgi:hypothetical protein
MHISLFTVLSEKNAHSAVNKAGYHQLLKVSKVFNGDSLIDQCIEDLTLTDILKIKHATIVPCVVFSQNIRTYLQTIGGNFFQNLMHHVVGPDSVAGITTCYGLDGPGIKSRWRRDFPHLSRPALGSTQPPIQ